MSTHRTVKTGCVMHPEYSTPLDQLVSIYLDRSNMSTSERCFIPLTVVYEHQQLYVQVEIGLFYASSCLRDSHYIDRFIL